MVFNLFYLMHPFNPYSQINSPPLTANNDVSPSRGKHILQRLTGLNMTTTVCFKPLPVLLTLHQAAVTTSVNFSNVLNLFWSVLIFAFLPQGTKSMFVLLRILTDADVQFRYKCCKIFITLMRICILINRTWSNRQNDC